MPALATKSASNISTACQHFSSTVQTLPAISLHGTSLLLADVNFLKRSCQHDYLTPLFNMVSISM
jgi:hypothetical protein